VVSIDGKKKEFLGSLYREGKLWVPRGEELVRWDHDFPFLADGKVSPFGVYDLAKNSGVMIVGTGAESARFVVDCLRKWWAAEAARTAATCSKSNCKSSATTAG